MTRWLALCALLAVAACDPSGTPPDQPTRPAVTATTAPSRTPASPRSPVSDLLTGLTNPAVTPATISTTICTTGYTARVRPPRWETDTAKRQMVAEQYPGDPMSAWILDHRVPLEGGGAPGSATDHRNFLLQRPAESHLKDHEENVMRDDICSGAVPLRVAQRAMAHDWRTYETQVGDR